MIYIKKLSDKNKLVIFLIILISFFIILSIWYFNKNEIDKKLVMSKNIKEVSTTNEINIGLYSEDEIEYINPIEKNSEAMRYISNLVYDNLFEFNEIYKLKSKLIENYAKIDEKSYIFKLKEEITSQNGKMLTSKDIKNTIESIFLNQDSYYSKCVDNIQSVKIIDNTTFRINLIEGENDFEQNLIFPILTEELNVGTNDYKVKNINNEVIVLENEKIGQVINIYIYNNLEELYGDFKKKKLDIIKSVKDINPENYIGKFGYQEKGYKGSEYISFEFNNSSKYFKENNLQEAFLSAINCDEIVTRIFNKNAYNVKDIKYNLDKVVEILEKNNYVYKEDGWYNNGQVLNLNVVLNKDKFDKLEVVYMIEEQLQRVGIKTELILLEDEEYNKKVQQKEYDVLIMQADIIPWINKTLENAIICNKLSILYSLNLTGEMTPNNANIFNKIYTWKKVVK